MNRDEIREILASSRFDGQDESDPRVASALKSLETDRELTEWFAEEQAFDRKFALAMSHTPVPAGLKTRIMASTTSRPAAPSPWSRRVGLIAAAIVALLVLFSSWQGPFQPGVSLADYRGEMVSFIRLAPAMDLESHNLDRIQAWLHDSMAPANVDVPPGLAALNPMGCRVFSFRRHQVSLICFSRGARKLAHLFVVDEEAVPGGRRDGNTEYAKEGEWMTATWREHGRIYLLAAQGDRELLEHYFASGDVRRRFSPAEAVPIDLVATAAHR